MGDTDQIAKTVRTAGNDANDHKADGKFAPGNRAAAGRSSRSAALRKAFETTISEQAIAELATAMLNAARLGDVSAAKLITWVVEIKRSSAPTVSKGFHLAATDVGATRKLLVAPVATPYPIRDGIEVMNPLSAAARVAAA